MPSFLGSVLKMHNKLTGVIFFTEIQILGQADRPISKKNLTQRMQVDLKIPISRKIATT